MKATTKKDEQVQEARAGDLKGELVNFPLSERFDGMLSELVLNAFSCGVVDDESVFAARR